MTEIEGDDVPLVMMSHRRREKWWGPPWVVPKGMLQGKFTAYEKRRQLFGGTLLNGGLT